LKIVRESHPFAAAFKPNIAFFECFGEQGYAALREVIHAIPNDIPIVLDCKRGDIDTTAQVY
jgi:uridine monophosphate synthetase